MMRFHSLSPDILPLTNGRKSNIRATCKEEDTHSRRTRTSTSSIQDESYASESPVGTARDSESQLLHLTPSHSPNKLQSKEVNGVLLQWGQNKRSRRSRASGDEQSPLRLSMVKLSRRSAIAAAEKVAAAAAAMPPPCDSYTRVCKSLVGRDSIDSRAIEDRSVGLSRSDKRSQSPARKPQKPFLNGDCIIVNPESKQQPSDQETSSNGAMTATMTTKTEKINLDHFEWPRIYLTLSRKEKEDDFLAMKGAKLPQRPRKRAKNVDRNLQYCFPGMWLSDLTRSRYEVREKKSVKKLQRNKGLKGMESMDSDSE